MDKLRTTLPMKARVSNPRGVRDWGTSICPIVITYNAMPVRIEEYRTLVWATIFTSIGCPHLRIHNE